MNEIKLLIGYAEIAGGLAGRLWALKLYTKDPEMLKRIEAAEQWYETKKEALEND